MTLASDLPSTAVGTSLQFMVESSEGTFPLSVVTRRNYIMGFTQRDPQMMQRHLEEVEKIGVPAITVEEPPAVVPVGHWAITTATELPVNEERTTAEVEFALIQYDGRQYLGVGSDHTDRTLEETSIPWSKMVCAKVIAPVIWPLEEVVDHWDDLVIESHLVIDGKLELYQHADGACFWPPDQILEGLARKVKDAAGDVAALSDFVALAGTVVSEGGLQRFVREWEFSLEDPTLGRSIRHRYTTPLLKDEVDASGMPHF